MLNLQEASRLLSISNNTLRRWANVGKIESWSISSRGDRRFKKEDIERLAEDLRSKSVKS